MPPDKRTEPIRFECTGNLFTDALKLHARLRETLEPRTRVDWERKVSVRIDPRPVVLVGRRGDVQEAVELALLAGETFLLRVWDEDNLVHETYRPKVGEVRLLTAENGESAVEITLTYEHVSTEIPPGHPDRYGDGPDHDPF